MAANKALRKYICGIILGLVIFFGVIGLICLKSDGETRIALLISWTFVGGLCLSHHLWSRCRRAYKAMRSGDLQNLTAKAENVAMDPVLPSGGTAGGGVAVAAAAGAAAVAGGVAGNRSAAVGGNGGRVINNYGAGIRTLSDDSIPSYMESLGDARSRNPAAAARRGNGRKTSLTPSVSSGDTDARVDIQSDAVPERENGAKSKPSSVTLQNTEEESKNGAKSKPSSVSIQNTEAESKNGAKSKPSSVSIQNTEAESKNRAKSTQFSVPFESIGTKDAPGRTVAEDALGTTEAKDTE